MTVIMYEDGDPYVGENREIGFIQETTFLGKDDSNLVFRITTRSNITMDQKMVKRIPVVKGRVIIGYQRFDIKHIDDHSISVEPLDLNPYKYL